jgi:hypothetical protein
MTKQVEIQGVSYRMIKTRRGWQLEQPSYWTVDQLVELAMQPFNGPQLCTDNLSQLFQMDIG